jgi:hypothetical protein
LIYRQKRSRSREKEYEHSRKPGTSFDRRVSISPERKPALAEIVKPIKTEAELKEEAAAAALLAKVCSNVKNLNYFSFTEKSYKLIILR